MAWGVPISTDTAVLLGVLALVGSRCPDQLRLFLLALAIADDIGAVLAIALFYTAEVDVVALLLAVTLFACLLGLRFVHFWRTPVYVLIGVAMWLASCGRRAPERRRGGDGAGSTPTRRAPGDIAASNSPAGASRRSDAAPAAAAAVTEAVSPNEPAARPAVEQLRHRAAVRAGERGCVLRPRR